MAVPYTFGTATAAIPLSQLDSNFATAITLGNTAVYLGNTTTSIGNLTLTNVTISSGSVTITDTTVSGNVTLSGGTANGVAYLNGSKVLTTGSALTFDGTNFLTTGSATGTAFIPSGSTVPTNGMYLPTTNSVAWSTNTTERMRLDASGNVGIGTSSPNQKLTVNGGVNIIGAATLSAAQGAGLMSFESPIMRCYVGDGTGYSWAFSKRAASVTTDLMTLTDAGNLGLGVTPNASAIFDAQSTTKGVRMPNMTTTQKNAIASPAAGLMVFDTTLAKLCVYSGSAWQTITSI